MIKKLRLKVKIDKVTSILVPNPGVPAAGDIGLCAKVCMESMVDFQKTSCKSTVDSSKSEFPGTNRRLAVFKTGGF